MCVSVDEKIHEKATYPLHKLPISTSFCSEANHDFWSVDPSFSNVKGAFKAMDSFSSDGIFHAVSIIASWLNGRWTSNYTRTAKEK